MLPQRTDQQPLVTVPNSLRQQLERAQNLLDQSEEAESYGDRSLAVVKAREATRVVERIAQQCPDIGALIVLADMGYRGFEVETMETVDRHQLVQRTFLGIPMGQEVVSVPTITRRYIRARLL
jgi:hypothetical protein